MTAVTVSRRGEVKLPKDVLDHLAVRPGDEVRIEKLPKGVVSLHRALPGDLSGFCGSLTRDDLPPIPLDEINGVGPDDWEGGM